MVSALVLDVLYPWSVCLMGMSRDLAQRVSLARVDDVGRCSRVQAAQTAVNENNHSVNGAAIKRLLDQDSLVPSIVSVYSEMLQPLSFDPLRMHSPINFPCLALTCLTCWW